MRTLKPSWSCFNQTADLVLPLTQATPQGKRAMHNAIQQIEASGSTAMSQGLKLARDQFALRPGAVCQGYFLTDGKNEGEHIEVLADELAECEGRFQLHCRGVGTDYVVNELRLISEKLLGTLDGIADTAHLAEDFQQTLAAAMTKSLADVRLRLWMPKNTTLRAVEQSFPVKIDMTGKARQIDQRIVEFSLGAWGEGTQDYSASFDIIANEPGSDPTLVARPSLVFTDPATGQDTVVAVPPVTVWWTQDEGLSGRVSPEVAHYQEEGEKKIALQEGVDALARQDEAVATIRLKRALELAKESGDEATTLRIKSVADVQEDGTIVLKRNRTKAAVMDLDVGSTRTVRAKRG